MIMEEKAITTKGQPVPAETRYDSGQELENIKKERQEWLTSILNSHQHALQNALNHFETTLTEDSIQERLKRRELKGLLKDISNSKETCILGLYKLDGVEAAKNLFYDPYADQNLWNWLATVTTMEPYRLQEKKIDDLMVKYIAEPKNDIKKKFDQIIQITENNGSSNSLKVYTRLMGKVAADLEEEMKKKKPDNGQIENCVGRAAKIFKSLNTIIDYHLKNKSFSFYLEMNPEEIRSIFEHEKKISSKANKSTNWKELFLRNLIAYYVAFAGHFLSTYTIASICDQWKLQKIFELAYEGSEDITLQTRILESFSTENEYLPYLPINIIEGVLEQNDGHKLDMIIRYLQSRYPMTDDSERVRIKKMNDQIILDSSKDIGLRETAFTWYLNTTAENATGERALWCHTVLETMLRETPNDIQEKTSFKNIVEQCYNCIPCENRPNSLIESYRKDGKNEEIRNLFYTDLKSNPESLAKLLSSSIDENKSDKINDLIEYLIDYVECMKYMDSDASCDSIVQNGIVHVVQYYQSGHIVSSRKGQFNKCSADFIKNKSDVLKDILGTLGKGKENYIKENISRLYSQDNDVDFNINLLHGFFSLDLETFPIPQLQDYVEYLWKNKEPPNQIKPILKAICNSNRPDIIWHLVEKGWSI